MQPLLQKLRDIELKIKALGDRYEILKQQNKQLKQENISLKQDLDLLSQDRMTLVRELESAKSQIGQDGHSEKDKKATDKLLGLYIREVDKCINLMQEIS
jgi:chromosome segregation ATPase